MKNPLLNRCTVTCALVLASLRVHAVGDEEQLRLFVERAAGPGQRVEVSVGAPASHMQLAPCARMEPFIPPGARLWGRTTLGVQCVEGARWRAFLPVNIRVFGQAPVAARALAPGQSVGESDVTYEEVELSRYPIGSIADLALVRTKELARPVAAGQPLLAAWFRGRPVIAQGDTVRVLYAGPGFAVSAEGRAMQHALEGESVRVTLESGRTVTGIARAGRIVELKV